MAEQPTKVDIQSIFKRLRSIPTNKQCFDCGSSNPTWASVTYGVFLCIDCSAVHRSLGVHVTFIRSTQLDTNWTWLQLRAMQVGGNANATAFFRHHGCTTKDAQQKYHSRAASMYRDKLHNLATQAMKLHGTKLHIDSQHDPTSPEAKEVDFFAEHTEFPEAVQATPVNYSISDSAKLSSEPLPIQNGNGKTSERTEPTDGPSVEAALSMSPTQAQAQAEPRKAIIGGKKPTAAKKGKFGAQKVKTNFSEIESRAQQMDKDRETLAVSSPLQDARSVEEQEKQMASMRLAYQDMNVERKKQEEKLKVTDPKKAEQMERLGMGFGGNKGISHSAMSDMKTIEQEAPASSSKSSFDRFESTSRKDFFEDEFEVVSSGFSSGPPKYDSPFVSDRTRKDDFGSWGTGSNKSSSWDMDRFESKQQSFSETLSSKEDERSYILDNEEGEEGPSRNRKAADSGPSTDEAQKKFGNAKSISSNQFFGDKDPDFEVRQNLSKYEGSSSISSSDIFGNEEKHRKSYSYSNAPDLQDIKDGVRQGVTKVAGKLSTLANGVMSSLQDHYGS